MARINRDDIDKFHDYGLYIPARTVYIGSEEFSLSEGESGVDGQMAEKAIKNLMVLEHLNKNPIVIVMNNVGGDVYHGRAIYDAIRSCRSHVTIKALGHAMSMGSVILQSADLRIMAPNARQMVHYGSAGVPEQHAKTFQRWAKEYEKLDGWMEQIYLAKMKAVDPTVTLQKVKKLLEHDTFLSAEKSIELGLADKIAEEE